MDDRGAVYLDHLEEARGGHFVRVAEGAEAGVIDEQLDIEV